MEAHEILRSYLTLREFSVTTGLSESTLRRRVRDGSLPFVQPGGPGTRILFRADALERKPEAGAALDQPEFNRSTARSIHPASSQPAGARPRWTHKLSKKKPQ